MSDESKNQPHAPSALQTLMLAEQFLYNAAQPYEKTHERLIEITRALTTLREHGPTQAAATRLADLIGDLEEECAIRCPIAVTIEGPDVVIRIQCVPQEP